MLALHVMLSAGLSFRRQLLFCTSSSHVRTRIVVVMTGIGFITPPTTASKHVEVAAGTEEDWGQCLTIRGPSGKS